MSLADTVTTSETLTGRVKWFNNKTGYGFITVTSGDQSGSDIFVHHSGINVSNQQYKYLVQGEYVDFGLEKPASGSHEFNATNVNGVNGGKLMCETRRETKLSRSSYVSNVNDGELVEPKTPRQQSVEKQTFTSPRQVNTRSRGEGPRESQSSTDQKEWTTVKRGGKGEQQTESKPSGKPRGRPVRSVKS